MKNLQKGFTLIELLVVIVIIGILATISTATFSGYFKKARDTERQTFVRNAQQIVIAARVSDDTPDYNFGGADAAAIKTAVLDELDTQGYSAPDKKNGIDVFYLTNAAAAATATEFQVVACKEENLGDNITVGPDLDDHVYSAGNFDTSFVTPAQAVTLCATTPVAPANPATTTATTIINLSS